MAYIADRSSAAKKHAQVEKKVYKWW